MVDSQQEVGSGVTEFWTTLPTILGSATVTGGGLLILSYLLLQRGVIHTNGELVRTLEANDKAHAVALLAKDELIAEVRHNAEQALADRDVYRAATTVQTDRANTLQTKMIEEVVPLVRVATTVLEALPKAGDGR